MTPTRVGEGRGCRVEENASPNYVGNLFHMDFTRLYRVLAPYLGIDSVEIKHPHATHCLGMFSPSPSISVTKLYPQKNLNQGEGCRFLTPTIEVQ